MPIVDSDILFKYAVTSGTAGNQNPQTSPNASLGKYISTTVWPGNGTLHDLFGPITGLQNIDSAVDYRCLFIHNNNGTLTLSNILLWISGLTVGGATIQIGADTTPASGINTSTPQALQVVDINTAPTGVSFSAPITEATGISLGNLLPGQCIAFWIKRSAGNTPALNNDTLTLSYSGDSPQ